MRPLRVSDNKRFLVHQDGSPFFYLGDTAWELFHRCTRDEADHYLVDRAKKGFTVIQAVVLAELDGLNDPNPQGNVPLHDNDPARPNEAYFAHVDFVVERAASLGLTIGMLPTWGDKWNKGTWGAGPEIFTTPESARTFGAFLGDRYKNAPLIWILGGDRSIQNDTHRTVLAAMAEGLRAGDGGNHLVTLHPQGGQTSSQNFHDAPWLDFNMWQTGHGRNRDSWNCIAADHALSPTKPCMDAEPGYEDHPAGFDINNGYLDDYDCRKSLYWGLFAGAHGHTYGCHPIWQMWRPDRKPLSVCRRPWYEALHLPGSAQMQHAKNLLLSRPFLSRVPDQDLIVSEIGENAHHVQASRDADGSYALVYVPSGKSVDVDLAKLSGGTLNAFWFDPRTGTSSRFAALLANPRAAHTFTPPSGGPDWVLVLDDAARNFPYPGAGTAAR
jgi:hypothetical protein